MRADDRFTYESIGARYESGRHAGARDRKLRACRFAAAHLAARFQARKRLLCRAHEGFGAAARG
ncbi:hypothetical protein [Paraburkholderia sp. J41]|uniref:hypothetical protein n=1 Tax=Paraburkholderia sp. J41 TaxID=2805433 RepID=UPI002AC36FD0|nr:hypothetical protein [Paraburkholderia sp. J41]